MPTIAVVSDDEGFSSGSGSMKGDDEIDNNIDEDDNNRIRKLSTQQVKSQPVFRRKMSFFVDIDPNRTPPPTPKISQRSNEEIIFNYSNEEIENDNRVRKMSRKRSFLMEIDPTTTPPPTPKSSQRSNEEIIINYSSEEINKN